MASSQNKPTSSALLRRIFFVVAASLLVLAVAGYLAIDHLWRDAPGRPDDPPVTVFVQRGSSLPAIAATLADHGVIADERGFILLARYRKVAGKLKAGEYAIRPGLPMRDVLAQLVDGKTVLHRFTVVPGETAAAVADKLVTAGLDPKNEAHQLIEDRQFIDGMLSAADSLEGYLFPETYLHRRGDDARAMYTQMVDQFTRVWNELNEGNKPIDPRIVIMASIVEKESGYAPELPKIARVFFNRLRARIPLQADPTVIYAQGKSFTGRLTRVHLRRDHPYNTYTRRGLPPGPICNPGRDALAAALQPAAGDWLYFVADGTGKHVFSETLEQHNEAVRNYRKIRR